MGNILDPADCTAKRFDFGLYVDPVRFGDQRFPHVAHWVDPLLP